MGDFSALLELWGQPLLLSIPTCLFLAGAALPCLSLVLLAMGRKRGLYERCARQIAQLDFGVNWTLLICCGFFFFWHLYTATTSTFFMQFGIITSGFLLIATLLWSVYAKAWKTLRSNPIFLWLFGLMAWICEIAILCLLFLSINDVQFAHVPTWQGLVSLVASSAKMPQFLLLTALLFLSAASAGGLSLIWLVMRRNKDEYGRDYYTFAANWCGRWGSIGAWGALILFAIAHWLVTGWTSFSSDIYPLEMLSGIPLGISAVLWTAIALSKSPMRHKIGMVCALICLLMSVASGALLADFASYAASWI